VGWHDDEDPQGGGRGQVWVRIVRCGGSERQLSLTVGVREVSEGEMAVVRAVCGSRTPAARKGRDFFSYFDPFINNIL
jgi:hypothetical protein